MSGSYVSGPGKRQLFEMFHASLEARRIAEELNLMSVA